MEGALDALALDGVFVDFVVCVVVLEPEIVWPTVAPLVVSEFEESPASPAKSKMPADVTAPVELSAFL